MNSPREIGFLVPQHGSLSELGERVLQGARIAVDDAARAGQPYELRVRDTAGDPDRTRDLAQEAIDAGVPVIAGPVLSDVVLAVRDVVERERIPFLPAMGGNPRITRPGTDYTFRYSSSNRQSGLGTAQFFRSVGVDRIAVIAADAAYPRAIVDVLRANGDAHGIDLSTVSFTPLGTADFEALVDEIDPTIEGVFLPYPGKNAVRLLEQLDAAGVADRATVLGDYSFGSPTYAEALEESIAGVYDWAADTDAARTRAFFDAVRDRFDRAADVYHCFGYDVVTLVAESVPSGDAWGPRAIRDGLRVLEYDAVAGWAVDFDEHGRNDGYSMIVSEWTSASGQLSNRPAFRSDRIAPSRS